MIFKWRHINDDLWHVSRKDNPSLHCYVYTSKGDLLSQATVYFTGLKIIPSTKLDSIKYYYALIFG
jgi:hypothetical protein